MRSSVLDEATAPAVQPPRHRGARRRGARRRADQATPRRELSRFDTVLFLISAMVVMDTIGAIAVGGAQALTWLVVLFVLFFVPSALACAELGAALPDEGGAYVWVRRAFGHYAGSLTSFLYWVGAPVWIGGSVAVVAMSVYQRFFTGLSPTGLYLFGAVFTCVATVGAILPLKLGKWIPATGALGQIVLLALFTVSVILYGVRHGIHGIVLTELAPSRAVFIAVVPVLLYSFVGVELPSTAGEEMRDPRKDLPVAIARAGVAQAVLYGVPIVAVLLVLPADQITSLHGLIDAMEASFTVFGGSVSASGAYTLAGAGQVLAWVAAALFIWVLMASGTTWIMGAGRAQAAACLDGGGPRYFGKISPRTGVPVRMALASGAVSLLAVIASLALTGGDGQKYFSATLTLSIVLILLAYLLIFPAFLVLRYREPLLDRPFRVGGGWTGAWLITILTTGWSVLGSACLLWPGLGTADPDALLPAGFAGHRTEFELYLLVPLALVAAVTAGYHWFAVSRARSARAGSGVPRARHSAGPVERSPVRAAVVAAEGVPPVLPLPAHLETSPRRQVPLVPADAVRIGARQ